MNKPQNVKQKIAHEMRQYFLYVLFLSFLLSGFVTYQRLLLNEYTGNDYIHYGYSIFEAIVLAKVILIGQYFHLGERFANKPLIFAVIHKTAVFSIFLLVFALLERFVVGFVEGKDIAKIYQEFNSQGVNIIFAKMLIMIFVFMLFFAFLEIGRVLGENKLFNLFFRRKERV